MCCMGGHQEGHDPSSRATTGDDVSSEPLLEILRRRFAQGEISREQLEDMKAVLGLAGETAATGTSNAWASPHDG